jgi:hypothetical protein
LFIAVLGLVFAPGLADAIPMYSVTASYACDTCHVEPLGWANPDLSERRCTMDCVGCHVSPAGGGLRTADGQYFGKEVLPMFGTRPSSFGNPEKYRPKGFPKKGTYSLFDGFAGWWPGKTPHTTIDDRYGNIDPKPKWDVGGDFRAAFLQQSTEIGTDNFVFPMQADLYVLNESVEDLQVYVNAGLQGRKDMSSAGDVALEEYFIVREAFIKKRFQYYNSYLRFGRIIPRFGWRTPDHTAFIRNDFGFNQNFQGFGVDGGFNPNYFYIDASAYAQGLAAWPGDRMPRGFGSTLNIGWRDLGWQIGSSFNYTALDSGDAQAIAGINWGLNLYPVGYYGEIDYRRQMFAGDLESEDELFAFHEIAALVTRGIYARFKYDWADSNLARANDHKHRLTLAADVHPYTFTHIEAAYRLNYGPVNPITNLTDSAAQEILLIGHVWF